jgi:serine/threonine protein kinase
MVFLSNLHCPTFAKLFSLVRALYKFGRTLGAGTYGIVREAETNDGQKVAVKIILKKNVRGNETMVYDELEMLQSLQHPHIVSFVDWFESKVSLTQDRSHWRFLTVGIGQILHCHATSCWRRAVRPHLRVWQVH